MDYENSSKEAERHEEISTKFQSSEEPNRMGDNFLGIPSRQLSFEKNNMEADVSSGKNNLATDLASVTNNIEDEVLSGKNNMRDDEFLLVKNNVKDVLSGKNNMEDDDQVEASSKPEPPKKKTRKKLRAQCKIVKKCEEAGGSAGTFSKLQSSEEPSGKVVNPPKVPTKQLSFGKNNMDTELLPGNNIMEAGNQREASSKPELSTKKTSKMLKARPKIVKKSLAYESLKANMVNGTSKVKWRIRRKTKKLNSREEITEKCVTNKVCNEGNLEIKNKETVGGSDESQQNQSEGKHVVSDKSSRQKNKEKGDGVEKSEQNEMNSDKLGGLIFMCSTKTKPDCFHYRLMGVSMNKKDLVLGIKPGLKLFLYDFDLKLLYGIYKASSSGGLKIEPRAFGGAFPVQVRFDIHQDCFPLPESVFRKAIEDNYDERRKFNTELTVKQVRKLSELFRTLPGGLGCSPAMPAIRDGESCVRVRESRPHSSRQMVGRDPYLYDNDRSYHILPHERHTHTAYQEITPQRREEISRDIYPSEKQYRAYGLLGERRNLTRPCHAAPSPHHATPILDPYERDHAREHLIRQPDLTYRDIVSVHGESSRIDPLYLTERQSQAYKLGAKLELPSAAPTPVHRTASVTASGTGSVLDHCKRDPYYPYHYGASSVDSYRLPVRRDEVSSGTYSTGGRIETYPGGMNGLQRRDPDQVERLHSTQATDALSNYSWISHYQGTPHVTAPAPVSSQYSFAGPFLSYR